MAIDARVLDSQVWVNAAYAGKPGFVPAPENGRTGWPTMYALIRALQIEVGVPAAQVSDTFGALTLSKVTALVGEVGPNTANQRIIQIVKCGLYCKGYQGDGVDGVYSSVVASSVISLRKNMGFMDGKSTLSPKEFQALLTMDAYVLVLSGAQEVRDVQQWMNQTYISKSWFSIIPADGYFSRNVQKGLVYALQDTLGIASPTGAVGPATLSALQAKPAIAVGSADAAGALPFVRLLKAAMIFNRYFVTFDGSFNAAASSQVKAFQTFTKLAISGKGDYSTWCSLLISSGDTTRTASASDTITQVTAGKGAALFTAGYRVVGRYLTNAATTGALNKKLQPGELAAISAAGLSTFPIYQTYGGSSAYFNASQGRSDGDAAVRAALNYGYRKGTTIYFAVDFDATDGDVSESVIPHFRGINEALRSYDNYYQVGVYASRNPCSRLFAEGLTSTSFVLDMSNGYSGNLGFVMPTNWAFDQITTITVGAGVNAITIDKVISSGKDAGQATVVTPPTNREQAFDFSRLEALKAGIKEYLSHIDTTLILWPSVYGSIDRVMQYDSYITNLSWLYGVRKALIQSVTFWEDYKRTVQDDGADLLVRQTYTSKEAMIAWLAGGSVGAPPTLPVIETLDCSTGLAQIFAKTAIAGRNWARTAGILSGPVLDPAQWQTVWSVWQSLNGDDLYNIGSVPGVLSWGAADMAIPRPNWDSTPEQTQRILARYNGKGVDADKYGVQLYGVYAVFETFNAYSR